MMMMILDINIIIIISLLLSITEVIVVGHRHMMKCVVVLRSIEMYSVVRTSLLRQVSEHPWKALRVRQCDFNMMMMILPKLFRAEGKSASIEWHCGIAVAWMN